MNKIKGKKTGISFGCMALAGCMVFMAALFISGARAEGKARTKIILPSMMGWVCIKPAIDRTADFEKEHPDIKIEWLELPYAELHEKQFLEASMGAGALDMAMTDATGIPPLKNSGMMLPLNKFVERDFGSVEAWNERFYWLNEIDLDGEGNVLFVPFHANVPFGVYRKDLFEDPKEKANFKAKYGYDLAPPETWEQVRDVARFFTRDLDGDGEIDQWGITWQAASDWVGGMWISVASSFGMSMELLDEQGRVALGVEGHPAREGALKGSQYWYDLMYKDKCMPPFLITIGVPEQWEMWKAGKIAMSIDFWGDYWAHPDLKIPGEVGSFVAPLAPGATAGHWGSWWTVAGFKEAKNHEAIWEIIKWLTSKEIQAAMSEGSGQGSPIKAYNKDFMEKGWVSESLHDGLMHAVYPWHVTEFPLLFEVANTESGKMITDQQSPTETIDSIAKGFRKVLKKK